MTWRTSSMLCGIASVVLLWAAFACAERPQWNKVCPGVIPEGGAIIAGLQSDRPDDSWAHRAALDWPFLMQAGPLVSPDANQLVLCKKVLADLFKPGVLPAEPIDARLVATRLPLWEDGNSVRVVAFRVKTDAMVIQFVKLVNGSAVIGIRPIADKDLDIPTLAKEVFNERVLPVSWTVAGEYHIFQTPTARIIRRSGSWLARDCLEEYEPGKYRSVDHALARPSRVPLGTGLFGEVNFYTDNRFAVFMVLGGPSASLRRQP